MLIKEQDLHAVPGVYGIFTKEDICLYSGGAKEINDPFNRHKTSLENRWYENTNKQIIQDIYDKEDLYFRVLEFCSLEELDDRETYWINYYKDTVCNSDSRGKRRRSKSTPEERERRRKANIGENNPNSRLTKEQVAEIKSLLNEGKYRDKEIAKTFNVSISHINNIRRGVKWASVSFDYENEKAVSIGVDTASALNTSERSVQEKN